MCYDRGKEHADVVSVLGVTERDQYLYFSLTFIEALLTWVWVVFYNIMQLCNYDFLYFRIVKSYIAAAINFASIESPGDQFSLISIVRNV